MLENRRKFDARWITRNPLYILIKLPGIRDWSVRIEMQLSGGNFDLGK